ncbi:uncharacterized protein VTP21DRAFT_904 [Calcarisporiella thermophila]|uniref:uncharacterized protein n=1 Tax=Calcarisporiella thermophila TaxID=911321 RepID=UPI003742DE31
MSSRITSAIVPVCRTFTTKSANKGKLFRLKTPSNGRKLTDFERKVLSNPYVAALSSPLRHCTYHDRVFPNAFLTRFIEAYDPSSNRIWIVPDTDNSREGYGRWCKFRAKTIEALYKDDRYKLINPTAYFRSDMPLHIWERSLSHARDTLHRTVLRCRTREAELRKKDRDRNKKVKRGWTRYLLPMKWAEGVWRSEREQEVRGVTCVLSIPSATFPSNTNIPLAQEHSPSALPELEEVFSISPLHYYSRGALKQCHAPTYDLTTLFGEQQAASLYRWIAGEDYSDSVQHGGHLGIGIAAEPFTRELGLCLWRLHLYLQ